MPSVQRGQLYKTSSGTWGVRFYDEDGVRRRQGGFATRSAAAAWARTKVAEIAALRRGDVPAARRRDLPTLADLVEEFLGQHNAEDNTIRTLRARLRYATLGPTLDGRGGFGELRIDRLQVAEIGAWRARLPARSAWAIHKTLRQVLHYAVRAKLVDDNQACAVPNPEPKRREVAAFASVGELTAVGEELELAYRAVPPFAALTGLRPEEWIALTRADVDRTAGIVHVRRVYTDGQVKPYGRLERSLRAVPLPSRAAGALEEVPPRLDTPLLFPGARGDHLDLHYWRSTHCTLAVRAAGLEHRPPYALRHTYATFSIAAGVSLFELARFMGTSVDQIDRTYGHLLPDALDRTRRALDRFSAAENAPAVAASGPHEGR